MRVTAGPRFCFPVGQPVNIILFLKGVTMRPIFLLLALVGSTTLAFQPENELRTAIIRPSEGPVVGFIKTGMRQFLGIPYATPPLGNLRWRPPPQPASWTTPFEA